MLLLIIFPNLVVTDYIQIIHQDSSVSRMVTPSSPGPNGINLEKPFACPVPGCKKRYKNVNGIKYHSKNGHKHDGR